MTSPWKACDIRGPYPDEVNPELFLRVAGSLGSALPAAARVLVAGDFRASTPMLKEAIKEGLLKAGINVLDAGQLPTPVAYFAHRKLGCDAVMIVTASHSPPDHNGLKLMLGHLPPLPEDLYNLKRAAEAGFYRQAAGSIEKVDSLPAYKDWIIHRWSGTWASAQPSVVLDAGNGAWSNIAPSIFEALGFRVHPLFCEVDGSFPNRPPDCARASNLAAMSSAVRKHGAQVGIAWDGDGDRVAFSDEDGQVVSADEISVLLVRHLIHPPLPEKVVYDVKSSSILRKTILDAGATPIAERSGHAFIKRRMILEDCILGCEVSGHYFFREIAGGDDGLFTALLVCHMATQTGSVRKLRETLPAFHITPDLRLRTKALDFEAIVGRLREAIRPERESQLDGVQFETTEGSLLIRESVTEPAITLRAEGNSRKSLDWIVAQCLNALPEVAAEIENQLEVE